MKLDARTALSTLAIACLALSVSACAPEPDGAAEEAPEEVLEILGDAVDGPDADGDDGRVFDSSDDAVIQTVETTFADKNASASWEGETLKVRMDGSVDDPVTIISCTAVEALLADGEAAIIVLEDGELVCADRPQ